MDVAGTPGERYAMDRHGLQPEVVHPSPAAISQTLGMSQWGWSQFLGAKGEYDLLSSLLSTGSAINTLTSADSGWDLHLHLPKKPIHLNEDARRWKKVDLRKVSWDLSGRSAHVQVKRTSRSTPGLRVGTVRGWLTGTVSGTPTFLFWARGGMTAKWRFATPASLQQWMSNSYGGRDDTATVRLDQQLPRYLYDPKRFGIVADVWSKYGAVLIESPALDKAISTGKTLTLAADRSQAVDWAARLVSGCFDYDRQSFDTESAWQQPAERLLYSALEGVVKDGPSPNEVNQALQSISQDAHLGDTWHGAGTPTGTFHRTPNGSTAQAAAEEMLSDFRHAVGAIRAELPDGFTNEDSA